PYIPSDGLMGKVRRQVARFVCRQPMAIRLERPIVSITFDDFPQSAATTGKDAIEARGWRGTFYASAGYEGASNHLGKLYEVGDLRRLERDGHEFGCHTFSHLDAARTPAARVARDAAHNRAALAALGCERPPSTFAYPYGEASPASKRSLIRDYA